MSIKRSPSICILFVISLSLPSCGVDESMGPADAQLAKGGVPGAPGGDAVELLEYYIFRNDAGENFVHILAKGSFPRVNLNVSQDYIFNGIADDDYSVFYEITNVAPLPVGPDELPDGAVWEDLGGGIIHVDIPWNGQAFSQDYQDPPDYPRVETTFPDFPHVHVAGGDPYAFDIRFQQIDGAFIDGYQPQGIILGGELLQEFVGDDTLNVPVMDQVPEPTFHDDVNTIYSYATYAGAVSGNTVSIDEIVVDMNSVACEVRTVRTRVDGVKVTKQVTRVTLQAQVVVRIGGPEGAVPAHAWVDVMLASADDGPNGQSVFYESFNATHDAEAWAGGYTVSAEFENPLMDFQLRLAVPYVFAFDLKNQMVYDPGQNNDGTGDAWTTRNKGVITGLYDFPYAITDPFTVDCGR